MKFTGENKNGKHLLESNIRLGPLKLSWELHHTVQISNMHTTVSRITIHKRYIWGEFMR